MIKTLNSRKPLIALFWLISVVAAFAGGIYFRVAYYVYPNPIHSYRTHINCAPSPVGERYSAKGIAEANGAAEELILKSNRRRKNFAPAFFITPEDSGYGVHIVSGVDGTEFPRDLLDSVEKTVSEILERDFQTRLKTAEQGAPSNR